MTEPAVLSAPSPEEQQLARQWETRVSPGSSATTTNAEGARAEIAKFSDGSHPLAKGWASGDPAAVAEWERLQKLIFEAGQTGKEGPPSSSAEPGTDPEYARAMIALDREYGDGLKDALAEGADAITYLIKTPAQRETFNRLDAQFGNDVGFAQLVIEVGRLVRLAKAKGLV